jgi:hypothetical protein
MLLSTIDSQQIIIFKNATKKARKKRCEKIEKNVEENKQPAEHQEPL